MKYKKGEKVIFKYPEKSNWPDTKTAINLGYLIPGKTYTVHECRVDLANESLGESVCLIGLDNGQIVYWWVGLKAVESLKPRRQLPDWF